MQKIILFLSLCLALLNAQSNFSKTELKIESIKGNLATTHTVKDFTKGASGVVVRKFDDKHEAIIANVIVAENKNSVLTLQIKPYDGLYQDVLPNYDITPKVGDEVILNHLYNRALIIAPNQDSYNQVSKDYSNFEWIHPDLFAVKLISSYKAKPTKEQFQDECKDDNIGLLFFVIRDRAYAVDCKSFEPIGFSPVKASAEEIKPFYSRLKTIKGKLGGLIGGDKIKDFNSYYSKLLGFSR